MHDGAVLIIQHQALGQPGTILETLIHDGIDFDLRQLHGRRCFPLPATWTATARSSSSAAR